MTVALLHPLTGVAVERTEQALAAAVDDGFLEANRLRQQRAALLAGMLPLREALAEIRGKANLPPARHRTPMQDIVHACPRCGGVV